MDYYEQRILDPNLKFNLIGYSMRGAFSLILNNIEDRINCVEACVSPMSRPFSEVEKLNWPNELAEKMKAISPLYCDIHPDSYQNEKDMGGLIGSPYSF